MVKNILPAVAIIFLLASCSSLKPLNFTNNKQVVNSTPVTSGTAAQHGSQIKFIEDINVTQQATKPAVSSSKTSAPSGNEKQDKKETVKTRGLNMEETAKPQVLLFGNQSAVVEAASPLQLKYSILLDTEVEELQNQVLLESVDEWYGTRYRMGGTTKSGVDCSAFVQAAIGVAFGISLPRTAREQYKASRRISRTELKEGDLVFFNTRGGVSHVGIYLRNNKFIHASTSQGVTVSDMFEPYYLKRYVGAGRMEETSEVFSASH